MGYGMRHTFLGNKKPMVSDRPEVIGVGGDRFEVKCYGMLTDGNPFWAAY